MACPFSLVLMDVVSPCMLYVPVSFANAFANRDVALRQLSCLGFEVMFDGEDDLNGNGGRGAFRDQL